MKRPTDKVGHFCDAVTPAVAIFGLRYRQAKLTPAQVRAIRGRLSAGQPQRRIAAEFQISQASVSMIGNGRRWAAVK